MLGMGIAWPVHFFVTCYTGVAVTVLIVMLYRLLHEVPESKWLQKSLHGMQGVNVGKIKQVLKDQKTGEIEYVILVPSDSKTLLPLRWSQFEKRNDDLHLNMKQEDLNTVSNTPNPKDMSPDIQDHIEQIGRARGQLKAGYSQSTLRRVTPTARARSKPTQS